MGKSSSFKFSVYSITGGSAGSVNANFAHFDNFPKSSSADFGTFNTSQSHQTASAVSKVSANKAGLQTTDKYAALANLDNIFSAGPGRSEDSFLSFYQGLKLCYHTIAHYYILKFSGRGRS